MALKMELVFLVKKKSVNVASFTDRVLMGNYGDNISLTIVDDGMSRTNREFLDTKTGKIKINELHGNLASTYNKIIETSEADYLYFCSPEMKTLDEDAFKLTLDYALNFHSDIVCFGVQLEKQKLQLRFLESVSNCSYSRWAIFREAVRKNMLPLLYNKIYRTEFLRENLKFDERQSFEMARMAFDIEAYLMAQKVHTTAACLVTFEEVDEMLEPISVAQLDKYFVFLKEIFAALRENNEFAKEAFILVVLGMSRRLYGLPTIAKFAPKLFEYLQKFLLEDEVGDFIKQNYEDVFVNYFSVTAYGSYLPDVDNLQCYFANLIRFHFAENQGHTNEALFWLVRFVYNNKNTNRIGENYLQKLLKETLPCDQEEYNFILERGLVEYVANHSLTECAEKMDASFEEGDDESLRKALTMLGFVYYIQGLVFDAIQIFNDAIYSQVNKECLIPKTFLDMTESYAPIERKIASIFVENKEWLKLWTEGKFESLLPNLKTLDESPEKDIIFARICVELGAIEDAATFYKCAMGFPRNTEKYPMQEVLKKLREHEREDLIKGFEGKK
ncbi:MAG: hypothetical protein LBB04_01085 [Oscillospiraceae bacterium]|jgi:hypothetical protein|nr:hypothetical protein [Oscillospiraceae bacterium]